MKKVILLFIILPALVFTAKAQLGYNYAQYSLGFGFNYVKAKTDVPFQSWGPAANLNFNYNFTPFTTFGIEYEIGRLSGGFSEYYSKAIKGLNPTDANYAANLLLIPLAYQGVDPYYRDYNNKYQSITLHADMQLGEIIDYSDGGFFTGALKNIYVGTGIGMVYNKITAINRFNADTTYAYGGSDRSTNITVPVRIGYQFKIYNAYDEPSIAAEIGYQMNYVFGYGLDGYSDPLFTTRNFERYGGFHIGLKFNFGSVTSYRKETH